MRPPCTAGLTLTLALVLALTACSSDTAAPPASSPASTTVTTTTTPLATRGGFVGTRWSVVGLITGGITEPPPEGSDVHITFDTGGWIDGSLGCNSMSGQRVPDGATLVLGGVGNTKMACGDVIDWLDLREHLYGPVTVTVHDDGSAELVTDKGTIILLTSATVEPSLTLPAGFSAERPAPFPLREFDWDPEGPSTLELLEGTLRIDGDCAYVDPDWGGSPILVVFPAAQTFLSSDGDSIWGLGEVVSAGHEVALGGYGREPSTDDAEWEWSPSTFSLVQPWADGCLARDLWFLESIRPVEAADGSAALTAGDEEPTAGAPEGQEGAAGSDGALDEDAAMYAEEFGITLDEARSRLMLQFDLDEPIAEIVRLEGGRVAGWGIDHEPEYTGYVILKGDEPVRPETAAILAEVPFLEVRLGVDHTVDELLAAIRQLPAEVRAAVTFTDIDVEANAVSIGAPDEETATWMREVVAESMSVPVIVEVAEPTHTD